MWWSWLPSLHAALGELDFDLGRALAAITPLRSARLPTGWAALLNRDAAAGRRKRAQDLIQRHVRGGVLDLGDAGLACLDSRGQLLLGQLERFPLPTDRQGGFDARIEELPLSFRHLKEVCGVPKPPSSRFQCLSFFGFHDCGLSLR